MRRKILLILGISVLSFVVFVLASFYLLPSDKLRHLAEKTIENKLKQAQAVEIEDISISPLLNITAKNFRMTPRVTEPPQAVFATEGGIIDGFYCAPTVEDIPFVIDRIFVNPAVFSTIKKNPAGTFELEMKDGKVSGELKSKSKAMELTAKGENISLNEFALLSNYIKMQIYGNLGFDLRAIIFNNQIAEMSGLITATNTVMCPKRLKLNLGGIPYLPLPFTVFGNIEADVEIKNNRLVINKLTSDGPDIKLDVTGDISLKSATEPNPRLNIKAVITPDAKWLADNDMKVIYQYCEKHEDGSIHLSLKGTTKRPKHDCGTPIPEPVEEVATPEPVKKAEKPEETKKVEKPAETKKAEPDPEPPPEAPKEDRKRLMDGDAVYRPSGDKRKRNAEDAPLAEDSFKRSRNNLARPPRPEMDGSARNERFNREIDKIDADMEQAARRSGRSRDRMPRRGRGNPDDSDN